jgi:uncharacterized protein
MIRIMSRLAALFGLALMLATSAQAQQATPRPGPGAAVPTQNHLELARQLGAMLGIPELFDGVARELPEQIRKSTVTRPELTKDLEQVLEALKPELNQQRLQMLNTASRLYASRLTEAELKEIVGFFNTPAGKKYTEVTPLILDDVATETTRWAERMSDYLTTRVRAEMGKRGHQM